MEHKTSMCLRLSALLAQESAATNTAALEEAIEQHLATCDICR